MSKKTGVNHVCEACGKEFYVPGWRLRSEKNPGRFCTMACRSGAHWKPGEGKGRIAVDDSVLVDAYASGQTLEQIAAQYGVSLQSIAYRLDQAGVSRRKNTGANLRTDAVRRRAQEMHPRGSAHPGYRFDISIDDIVSAYKSGVSALKLARKYKTASETILSRLRKAGVTIRHQGYSRPMQAQDGHLVSSHWEQVVDDWLSLHKIPHALHPRAPWYTGKQAAYADFGAGDYYIEVWGLDGQAAYDARRLEKVAKYRECNAKLIGVFPHHILDGELDTLLAPLLTFSTS